MQIIQQDDNKSQEESLMQIQDTNIPDYFASVPIFKEVPTMSKESKNLEYKLMMGTATKTE